MLAIPEMLGNQGQLRRTKATCVKNSVLVTHCGVACEWVANFLLATVLLKVQLHKVGIKVSFVYKIFWKTFENKCWKTRCRVLSLTEKNAPENYLSKWNCHFSMIVFVCSQDRSKNELALSVHISELKDTRIIKVIMIS